MMALAVVLFATNSFAWDPPASPAPASWISDTSGVLSADAHARLDTKLKQINQSSANEVAALIVPTLDGQSIEDVANATFKSWGVGKKNLDNGVLVVLAMKEHKSRIETGKGVEGDLPDLKTQDILNNVVRPYMRKGDVEGALSHTFDAISSTIANHKADVAAGRTSSSDSCDVSAVGLDQGNGWLLAFLVFGSLVWLAASLYKRRLEKAELELQRKKEQARREQAARLQREQAAALAKEIPHIIDVPASQKIAYEKQVNARQPAEDDMPEGLAQISKQIAAIPSPTIRAVPRPKSRGTVESVALEAELERERKAQRERNRQAEEDRFRQEEEDRRQRRSRDEEDERRRRRDDDDSSSSSSGSGFDWGGGSSGSDSGGFGGGDSGGGGSSSDW